MKFFITIAFVLSFQSQCSAQIKPGCINSALCYSNIGVDKTPFAVFNNPASSAFQSRTVFSLFYSPAPYGINELSTKAFACKMNAENFAFLLGYQFFGYSLYKEQKLGIGFSYNIEEKILIGISTIYHNVSIKNYGSDAAVVFLAGVVYNFSNSFNLALTIFNPANTSYGTEENQIPIYYETGLSYKPSESSILSCSVYKELYYPISVRLGLSYDIFNTLSLQVGYKTEPESVAGGITISSFGIQTSYCVISHPTLGLSHQFGLSLDL